jgi:hypothetical protein
MPLSATQVRACLFPLMYTFGMVAPARTKGDPVREALARAPRGEPLTAEERARIEAVRTDKRPRIPHASIMAQLEERIRRGE